MAGGGDGESDGIILREKIKQQALQLNTTATAQYEYTH